MLHFRTNQTPANWSSCVFNLLMTMAEAGWQTIAWSDGTTAHNTPVANNYPYLSSSIGFTTPAAATNGLGNSRAWTVMQQPPVAASGTGPYFGSVGPQWSGTRQLCIQRGTSENVWRVKYSLSGAYTTPASAGTSTNTPVQNATLSDEVFIIGGGTDASPTFATGFGSTQGASRCNVFADDGGITGSATTPNPWPYGFALIVFDNGGTNNVGGVWMMDPLQSGSISGFDPDPYAFFWDSVNADGFNLAGQFNRADQGAGVWAWHGRGKPNAQFALMGAVYYVVGNAQQVVPDNLGSNPNSGIDDLFPCIYLRDNNTTGVGGVKGISSFCRWTGTAKSMGATFTQNTARDTIIMRSVALPWDGSAPTV